MELLDDKSSSGCSAIHRLNGSNYKLWKFQIDAVMKARNLTDVMAGTVPAEDATNDVKSQYERNDGKAMAILISSVDSEQANHILMCKTAKEIVDKLASIHEKRSEVRIMSLYEDYFSLKMTEDESVAAYVSKVSRMAHEIEDQGEKLSDNIKMVRIISSLTPKFRNFKTVWYNIKEARTLDSLLSRLQLEEDQMSKVEDVPSDAAFSAKFKSKQQQNSNKTAAKQHSTSIDELKKKTKCNKCHEFGHWKRECPKRVGESSESKKGGHDAAFCGYVENGTVTDYKNVWIADSGATEHMSFRIEWFVDYKLCDVERFVQIANGVRLPIRGTGTILIEAKVDGVWEKRHLKNVQHVPELKQNLFSTASATSKGFQIMLTNDGCKLMDPAGIVYAVGVKDNSKQLRMVFRQRIDEHANSATVTLQQLHHRLGHLNVDAIKRMCNQNLIEGVKLSGEAKFFCEDCHVGKMQRASHKPTPKRVAANGEYLHADLCGPMEELGIGGMRYFLLIKDEATSFKYVYLLASKSEVCEKIKDMISLVSNSTSNSVKHLRFDNGTEFINKDCMRVLSNAGVTVERIAPYTPEQNGRVEREMRTVVECARTMLLSSGLQKRLWPEAVRTAVYILNRSSNKKCPTSTPYENWFGKKPDMGHVRIFGSECFVQIPKQCGSKKWDAKAKKVFLVGYESTSKNFRLFDPETQKIIVSCNVKMNEKDMNPVQLDHLISDGEDMEKQVSTQRVNENEPVADQISNEDNHDISAISDNDFLDANDVTLTADNDEDEDENENVRKNGRYNLRGKVSEPDRLIVSGYSAVVLEPNTYEEALKSDEAAKWQDAMNDELKSLKKNSTWEFVNRPKNRNVVGCRWVYKLKPNPSGPIFKARLVAKGFSQREGVDFGETFSPVVRYDSIRTILSIAAAEDLEIMQFDVKTAFLNGDLDEEIFMEVPKGLDIEEKNVVCRLKKSLYGLKQASRVWNKKFTKFLSDFNMGQSKADPCVFSGNINGVKVLLLLYVDDGLVLSKCKITIEAVMNYLSDNFEITRSSVGHYVGMEIHRNREKKTIFINQNAYIKKVVEKFNMQDSKRISTPADSSAILTKLCEEGSVDFPYRQAIGSLMFAAIVTRPDISYAVGEVSRYMDNPKPPHVSAVKRILRYLNKTAEMGIEYSGSSTALRGYSDADYARDVDTRKSTTGYAFLVGEGIVTWKSRRQKSVALSTTEAEFMAACEGAKEAVWLHQLLRDVGCVQENPPTLYIDNQSAIRLIKNSELHQRTKHIDVRLHFIRQLYESKTILIDFVCSEDQLGDVFTKPLAIKKFTKNIEMLGMKDSK